MSIPRLCQRGHDLNDPAVGVVRTDGRVRCRICKRLNYKPHPRPSTLDRLLAKVDVDVTGCWNWTASKQAGGYGQIRVGGRDGRYALAHRVSYELHVGPIPDGLQLDHLCRNRACVNPEHLGAGDVPREHLEGRRVRRHQRRQDALPGGPSSRRRQSVRLPSRDAQVSSL